MKLCKVFLFLAVVVIGVALASNCWARVAEDLDPYSPDGGAGQAMPTYSPGYNTPAANPAVPGSTTPVPDDGPAAMPPAAPPVTQWNTGAMVVYSGNGMNLSPTNITVPANSQITTSGDTALTITTGTGSPIGVGIDNVTPISSFWAPGASKPTNLPAGSYVVSPVWGGSGLTTENPYGKKK